MRSNNFLLKYVLTLFALWCVFCDRASNLYHKVSFWIHDPWWPISTSLPSLGSFPFELRCFSFQTLCSHFRWNAAWNAAVFEPRKTSASSSRSRPCLRGGGTSQNLISHTCFQAATVRGRRRRRRRRWTRMESGGAVPAVGVPAEPGSRRAAAGRLPAAVRIPPRRLARPPGRSKGQPRTAGTPRKSHQMFGASKNLIVYVGYFMWLFNYIKWRKDVIIIYFYQIWKLIKCFIFVNWSFFWWN